MTTLFPQIKRVDEDETSKIIKNVLFDDHDEEKLEQIFDEFMHLTEESITYSDVDQENGDDEDDDDDDDEDDDDSESESESDSSESGDDGDDDVNIKEEQSASREPTSWNLDQFINAIPVTKPPKQTPPKQTPPKQQQQQLQQTKPPQPPPPLASPAKRPHIKKEPKDIPPQSKIKSQPTPEIQPTPKAQPIPKSQPIPKAQSTPKAQPIPKPQVIPKLEAGPKLEPTPQSQPAPQQQPTPLVQPAPQLQPTLQAQPIPQTQTTPQTQPTQHIQSTPQTQPTHQPSNGSCIVQIDLSRLKRIPTTKAPTPTVSNSSSLSTARSIKHEADAEKDKTKKDIKYLEAGMYFLIHGNELEQRLSIPYLNDLVPLFKHISRITMPASSSQLDNMTDLKVHILTLRSLSLLFYINYRSRERELKEASKIISSQNDSSPPSTIQQADSLLIGIKPQLLSAYTKQFKIFSCLREAHDYWHKADYLCDQHPALRVFLSTIDTNCGHLSMISPISRLIEHIKCGLKLLRAT